MLIWSPFQVQHLTLGGRERKVCCVSKFLSKCLHYIIHHYSTVNIMCISILVGCGINRKTLSRIKVLTNISHSEQFKDNKACLTLQISNDSRCFRQAIKEQRQHYSACICLSKVCLYQPRRLLSRRWPIIQQEVFFLHALFVSVLQPPAIGTSASEMTYIVSGGALHSTHSPAIHDHNYIVARPVICRERRRRDGMTE